MKNGNTFTIGVQEPAYTDFMRADKFQKFCKLVVKHSHYWKLYQFTSHITIKVVLKHHFLIIFLIYCATSKHFPIQHQWYHTGILKLVKGGYYHKNWQTRAEFIILLSRDLRK